MDVWLFTCAMHVGQKNPNLKCAVLKYIYITPSHLTFFLMRQHYSDWKNKLIYKLK